MDMGQLLEYLGGIVAVAVNTTIDGCHHQNDSGNYSNVEVRGGIIGWSNGCTIRNCSVKGYIAGGSRARTVL